MKRTVSIIFFVFILMGFMLSNSAIAEKVIWITGADDSGNIRDSLGVATDQGFVDLLTDAGYEVQREIMESQPLTPEQIDVLESGDLIIVSRSTNSGRYNTTSWNTVRKPLILMSVYLDRSTRWQWLDTSTQVGQGGAPMFNAVMPDHPIFAGVELDADGNVAPLDGTVGSGHTSLLATTDPGYGQVIASVADSVGAPAIIFWDWLADFNDASNQFAAAPRLLFPAGTQEDNTGPYPENLQGLYNLTDAGDQMLLNAVAWMLTLEAPGNITIDAKKDPWYDQLTGPADGMLNLPAAVYSDLGAPSNDQDLSVKVWTSWDETYYYLYEEVKDDIVLANNADNWWRNDIIELKIDPDPSAKTPQAGGSTVSVALTALDSADATEGGQIANMPADGEYPGASPGDWARRRTNDGYVLEMRVKW